MPSPFKDAFSRARYEARTGADLAEPAGKKRKRRPHVESPERRFEVRIERRTGKRSADVADWNALGQKGWELVSVVGKHAFFRRELDRR